MPPFNRWSDVLLLTAVMLCINEMPPVQAQIYTSQWKIGGRSDNAEAPGKFQSVSDVALDSKGNVYVGGSYSVQKFDRAGKFLLKFGERGTGNGQFEHGIGGIAVDPEGHIYLSDGANHRIQKFGRNGVFLSTFGTNGTGEGQFDQPSSLAADRAGNLFVLDAKTRRIQKFDSSGRFISSLDAAAPVKRPTRFYTPDNNPAFLCLDANGSLYVGYRGGQFVQKFSPNGKLLAKVSGFDGSPRITVDTTGKLYALDTHSCRVQMFQIKGTKATLVSKFRAPDDRVSIIPSGIAVDAKGDVYIGAHGNGMAYVRKFRKRYLAP